MKAREVLIATNAYSGALTPGLQRRVMPIASQIIVTERLDADLAAGLIPKNRIVFDTKKMLFYYRRTDDDRMFFGGRATFSPVSAQKSGAILRDKMVKLYPQLADAAIEYTWDGSVAFTFDWDPHMGRMDGLYYSMGYCGHGIALGTYMGDRIGNVIAGRPEDCPFLDLSFPTQRRLSRQAVVRAAHGRLLPGLRQGEVAGADQPPARLSARLHLERVVDRRGHGQGAFGGGQALGFLGAEQLPRCLDAAPLPVQDRRRDEQADQRDDAADADGEAPDAVERGDEAPALEAAVDERRRERADRTRPICIEVASMPWIAPSQRRGLTCTRKACLAGYDQATASPSMTLSDQEEHEIAGRAVADPDDRGRRVPREHQPEAVAVVGDHAAHEREQHGDREQHPRPG